MKRLIERRRLASYFCAAYAFSWGGGLILLVYQRLRGAALAPTDALLLFPVIVLGVAATGMTLTAILDGGEGVRALLRRILAWRVGAIWYSVALLTPPILILLILLLLRAFVSPVYAPNFFPLGLLFGIFPGFFEEIGWTGFAFPIMRARFSPLSAAIILGFLWGLWHLPVVDSLGAAAPHGGYWLPFFAAFIAVVAAMRVLISWVYSNTESLLLTQLMHASSTACLVIFGPSHVSPAEETLWYAIYALALWIAVAAVAAKYGRTLQRPSDVDRERTSILRG